MRRLGFPGITRTCFVAVCMLCAAGGISQVFFSTDPRYVSVKSEPVPLLSSFNEEFPDTSITTLHHYLPRNLLGNPGLPSPAYLLQYRISDPGFRFFEPPYQHSRFHARSLPYYRTAGPFASLTGVAGSKELQLFDAVFTQTYRSRLNLALGFRRFTSEGYYRRQQTFTNNFYATTNYTQPKGRFGFHLYFLNNANRHNENGGLSEKFLTDSTVLIQKDLMNVRLNSASRDNRENVVQVNPWFRLARSSDSAKGLQTLLSFRSSYKGASFEYGDRGVAVDTFYRHNFLHDTTTTDSSHVRQFTNGLSFVRRTSEGMGWMAGYRHELSRVWQLRDSALTNHIVSADLRWRFGTDSSVQRPEVRASAQYVVSGSNVDNYLFEGSLAMGARSQYAFDIAFESRDPDQIYRVWRSNHFSWYRHLRQRQTEKARLSWNPQKGLTVGAIAERVHGYLYFDTLALPKQHEGSVINTRVFVSISRVLWKHLGIRINYDYQATSAPYYVRLPRHHLQPGIFYKGFFFRNHLQLHLGAEAQLFDAFMPYAYTPATQAFHLQDQVTASPYPYADLYLNIRIRPVSVFFRLENVLKGFAGPDYFLVPGYYQPDRALRFGLNWMFFD